MNPSSKLRNMQSPASSSRYKAARMRAEARGSVLGSTVGESSTLASEGAHSGSANTQQAMVKQLLMAFAPCALPLLEDHGSGVPGTYGDASRKECETESLDEPKDPLWMQHVFRNTFAPGSLTYLVLLMYVYLELEKKRVEPCAKLECWEESIAVQGDAYRYAISNLLLNQYGQVLRRCTRERLFSSTGYGEMENSRELINAARVERARKNGRLLLHYNGHGMPPPTDKGEIWMLGKNQKCQAFDIIELGKTLDGLTFIVLDVDSAGSVLKAWKANRLHEKKPNVFLFCACSASEKLPQQPALPADLLTSCLTTPLRMAIEWYLYRSPQALLLPNVSVASIRAISTQPEAPLFQEMYLVLNAVLDTVAWGVLPHRVFSALFRHDHITKTLFRNFILALHVGHEAGCQPVSHPPLPTSVSQHYMWNYWEYTLDKALSQLPLVENNWERYIPYNFFKEQLISFKLWIERGDTEGDCDILPCVLQALAQQNYEQCAITLLIRYLDVSHAAATSAILCGIIPYLSRLYERNGSLLLLVLVLWMQCVRANPVETFKEVQAGRSVDWMVSALRLHVSEVEVKYIDPEGEPDAATEVKPTSASYTPQPLEPRSREDGPLQPIRNSGSSMAHKSSMTASEKTVKLLLIKGIDLSRCKAMVCYALCQLQALGEWECVLCWNARLLEAAYPCLTASDPELCSWGCLALGSLCSGLRFAKRFASQHFSTRLSLISSLLVHASPIVRSSCVTLLGHLVGVRLDLFVEQERQIRQMQMERKVLIILRQGIKDASLMVRREIVFFASQILFSYYEAVERKSLSTIEEYILPKEFLSSPHSSVTPVLFSFSSFPSDTASSSGVSWSLEVPEVRVKSSLHATKPTNNSQFAENAVPPITPLQADDPAPEYPLSLEGLDEVVVDVLRGLVSDSAKVLRCLYAYGDVEPVSAALRELSTGHAPASQRFAYESQRSMRTVRSSAAHDDPTEAERIRARWNEDAMQQAVADLGDRRLDSIGSTGGTLRFRPSSSLAAGTAFDMKSSGFSAARRSCSITSDVPNTAATGCFQVISSELNANDPIVASSFRLLEPQLVVVTKGQMLYNISYENFVRQKVLSSFRLSRFTSPVREIHVINDLSEHCGLLAVTKNGRFVILRGCTATSTSTPGSHGTPETELKEVGTFSPCPATTRGVQLRSSYVSNTATLIYGGPIGAGGRVAIHSLSLVEEQVMHELDVVGEANLTSLTAHPACRAVYAGFSDGVVRFYDDRQGSGQIAPVADGFCGGPGMPANGVARVVVGVGPIATGHGYSVVGATTGGCCIFDTRKWKQPISVFSHETLYRSVGDQERSSYDAFREPQTAFNASPTEVPYLSRCSVSPYLGLLGMCFSDAKYGLFSSKGQLLCDGLQTVTGNRAFSETCIAHPVRPFMSMSGDLLFL